MTRSNYLAYGGGQGSDKLDLAGTQAYLESLGFGGGDLRQAREALASRKKETFSFDALGGRYCDFCFARIMGGEYDELKDGRERCSRCARTVLNSHEEFVFEFERARSNMEIAFGITINMPPVVKMANAKEIARRTGESFMPSPGVDPRVLGFVERTDGGLALFIENGSPRLAAITTMAHELTHVWQQGNWDEKAIISRYGAQNQLVVYEGMATWVMIQYLLFLREFDHAQRQEAYALMRTDEYGDGFRIFLERYPLRMDGDVGDESPFVGAFPL